MEEMIKLILEKLDNMEQEQKAMKVEMNERFDEMNKRFDRIENKIGHIPQTYETYEQLLGKTIIDIEKIKKIIFNQ